MSEIKKHLKFHFDPNFGGKAGWGVNSETGLELPDPELIYRDDN